MSDAFVWNLESFFFYDFAVSTTETGFSDSTKIYFKFNATKFFEVRVIDVIIPSKTLSAVLLVTLPFAEITMIEMFIATVFVIGSTAGITTTEFEPGLANHDLKAAFEAIAPEHGRYRHEETWHDDNGHAHIRASLLGPALTVPIIDRNLVLGVWQQIVLIDFDTRGRQREVIVQVIGD